MKNLNGFSVYKVILLSVCCVKIHLKSSSFMYFLQVLVLGQPGEEVSLELILRVVADVGLVVSTASYYCPLVGAFVCNMILFAFPWNLSLWLGKEVHQNSS